MEEERGFKGIWIPRCIWLDGELSWIEKFFFVEIDSLDNDDGCFASNGYFSEFFGLSKQRCSQIINGLKGKKYISIRYELNGKEVKKRIIKVSRKFDGGVSNLYEKGVKKSSRGYQEKAKGNNTINKLNNNTSLLFDEKILKDCFNSWKENELNNLDWDTAILNLNEKMVVNMEEHNIPEAIKNYAIVLHDKKYMYTWKWMFWNFLEKGFKKFLTQSTPFEAFRDMSVKDVESKEDQSKRIQEAL